MESPIGTEVATPPGLRQLTEAARNMPGDEAARCRELVDRYAEERGRAVLRLEALAAQWAKLEKERAEQAERLKEAPVATVDDDEMERLTRPSSWGDELREDERK